MKEKHSKMKKFLVRKKKNPERRKISEVEFPTDEEKFDGQLHKVTPTTLSKDLPDVYYKEFEKLADGTGNNAENGTYYYYTQDKKTKVTISPHLTSCIN